MSDLVATHNAIDAPKTTYLKDYQVPNYFIDEIDLIFDLFDGETIVTSTMRVRHNRHSKNQDRSLYLNGEELELQSIKVNGQVLLANQYAVDHEWLIIHRLPDDVFTLEITNKIYPDKNTQLSGLYRSKNTYCTQCEAHGFRRITYFMDRPDVLSKYTTTIIGDAERYPALLSNGNLVERGMLDNGRHWVRWEDPFKKPCYLFALVAGDFEIVEDRFVTQSSREVMLRIYVEKGYANQASHAMYSVKEAMRWDEVAYGREYDLDIYMIVAIGDFNMGAMENKGLNIFNTQYILAKPETATDDDYIHIASVIAHEYFHNWTGNRVTCRDWFQLSLKEGLTIFRDQSFSEDTISHTVMRIRDVRRLREVQFPEDAGPLAHPVRPDSYMEINNFYTATIYEKGAEVLRMMQTILGKELFRKGMDLYFATYDGEAVTIDDFVATMESISGMDLKQFRLWYTQAGTPEVTVETKYDNSTKTFSLSLTQCTPPTPGQANKLPLHIPVRMALLSTTSKKEIVQETVLHLHQDSDVFTFENVDSIPVLSIFRHFSAPVNVKCAYTDEELVFLTEHDTDHFNRWEAWQQYQLRAILRMLDEKSNHRKLPLLYLSTFENLVTSKAEDKMLHAEMLLVPSEKMIGEQTLTIDVDAIHDVREFIISELATLLDKHWQRLYQENNIEHRNDFSVSTLGCRQLKNISLSYLTRLSDHSDLAKNQCQVSLNKNMTDTLAALTALVHNDMPGSQELLEQFYHTFSNDDLVVNKWLVIQATSRQPSTLARVRALLDHPGFDIKNPNKVYSLIGAFAQRNPAAFHASHGEGYVFLREFVQKLDRLNPQVAARMVNPLTSWRRYDNKRQQSMRMQLQLLLQDPKLSVNVYELVKKSLE